MMIIINTIINVNITNHKPPRRHYFWEVHNDLRNYTNIPGVGARSSAANFWPQLDNCGGGSMRDEGVGSVNSDLTEVNMMDGISQKA